MEKDKKIYYVNALFLGESTVGKTSIINRLIGKVFGIQRDKNGLDLFVKESFKKLIL